MHIEFFGIRFRPYPYPYPYPSGGLGVTAVTPPRFVLRIRQMVSWGYKPRKGTPMSLHGRNYDLHTGFHGAPEEIEPPDVFDEGDEDGIVWPIEPVLPLEEEFPPEQD